MDKRYLFSLPSELNQGERNGFSKLRMRWMLRAGVLPSARRKAFFLFLLTATSTTMTAWPRNLPFRADEGSHRSALEKLQVAVYSRELLYFGVFILNYLYLALHFLQAPCRVQSVSALWTAWESSSWSSWAVHLCCWIWESYSVALPPLGRF